MIRIAFRYKDPRFFSRLVTLLRGGDSAHCEAAWSWSGDAHRCVSSSWLDGGVRGKDIALTADKWRIYEVPEKQGVVGWLAIHSGAGYDVLGLLGILLPSLGHSRKKWFCSEAVADILGLPNPQIFDLRTLESVCAMTGTRIQ